MMMNVASVEFDDVEFDVGVYKYESKEQLAKLRAEHSSTHVFRREGGSELLAIPFVEKAPQLGDSTRAIQLSKNLSLTAALIRNSLTLCAKIAETTLKFLIKLEGLENFDVRSWKKSR